MRIQWYNHRDIRHPLAGGAERTMWEVCKGLVRRGHSVEVISCRFANLPTQETFDGVQIRRFAGNLGSHLSVPLALRERPRPEVVVEDLAHVVPWGAGMLGRVPTVAFFHHLHYRSLSGQVGRVAGAALKTIERTYPFIYRQRTFVTESLSSQEDLVSIGLRPQQIVRIPPGVDSGLFRPGDRSRDPLIVWYGRMQPYKRPEHALLALKELLAEGVSVRLLVIGGGPDAERLKQMARDLSIAGATEFAGVVSDRALASLLASSWVNVQCSRTEGWGLTSMEAAACGVPTVCYDVPGLRETVRSGETGTLVTESSGPRGLALALRKVIESGPGAYQSACLHWAHSHSWDATVSLWAKTLEVAAGG